MNVEIRLNKTLAVHILSSHTYELSFPIVYTEA
jgi:hypothetical protein